MSLFISGLLITYTGPVIAKSIITALPAEWIAFQSLFSSISALMIGMMWQGRIRRKIIKCFFYFCIAESVIGCLLAFKIWFIKYKCVFLDKNNLQGSLARFRLVDGGRS